MAGIVGLPRSWGRTKPPPGTPIDWGNPLTRGLIHAYLLNDGGGANSRDSCRSKDMGPVGSPTRGFGPRGPAVTLPAAGNYLTQPAWNPGLTLAGATWVVMCRLPALPAQGGLFFSRGSSLAFGMTVATDAVHLGFDWRDDWFSSWSWTGGPAIPTNKDCFLAISVGPTATLAVADDARVVTTLSFAAQSYNGAHSIGCDTYDVPNRTVPGRYDLALMWGRTLSAGELATIRADPYALWAPPAARHPFASPAAGAAAPPTSASAAWTAPAPVLSAGVTKAPTTAPAAWTASAPVARGDFVPTDLAGLGFWFKADALGLADGDPIGTLADSSGAGHAIAETGTNRATYRANVVGGLPVARFDGVANWYRSGDLLGGSGAYTISLVLEMNSLTPTYSGVVNHNATGDHGGYLIRFDGKSADYVYRAGSVGYNSYDGTGAATFDTTHFHVVTILFASDARLATYQDGVLDGSVTPTGGNDLDGSFGFGNQVGAAGRFLAGDIAEIVVYNSALSDADRGSVESYLNKKYQLTTPAVTTASPAAGAATWVAQAPAVSGGATKAATTVAGSWAAQASAVTGGATKAATTVTATWAAQAPVVTGGALKAPTSVVATWAAQAPTTSAGSTTTAPVPLAVWTVSSPAVSIGRTTVPATVIATWSAQAPATSAGSTTTAPAPLAIWTAPAPAVSIGTTTVPATVVATWTAQAGAAAAGALATPAVAPATWTTAVGAATAGATTGPTAVGIAWAAPTPAIATQAILARATVPASWSAISPGVVTGGSASVGPGPAPATWATSSITTSATAVVAPAGVASTWVPSSPAVLGSARAAPPAPASAWVATGPVVVASAAAAPPAGASHWTLAPPAVVTTAVFEPIVAAAHWTGSVPGVVTGGSAAVAPAGVGSTWIAQVSGITGGAVAAPAGARATWTPVLAGTPAGGTAVAAPGGAHAAWTGIRPAALAGAGPVVPAPAGTWIAATPMVTTAAAPVVIPGPSPYQGSVARLGPDPWEGGATAPGVVPDRGTIESDAVAANYSSVTRMR